jgi:hypothetical protein
VTDPGCRRIKRRTWFRFLTAVAVSTIVTVAWAFPLVLHLNSRVLGGPSDSTSTIRDYWAIAQAGKTPFTATHDALIGAPEGVGLSPAIWITNAFQPAMMLAFTQVVGLVAAWNILLLGGIVLTAACMWLLLDDIGVGTTAAFSGGYAFGFSGYLVDKAYAGHNGLVQAWVFPLIAIALLRTRGRHPTLWSVVAGALVGLASYVHTYYGFIAAFLVVVFFAFSRFANRRGRLPRTCTV